MTVDLQKIPPLLPADVARVLDDGKPTPELLDYELSQGEWYEESVTDLQTQVTTVISATNDNSAAITVETNARTSEDEALAEQILTVQANVGDVQATVEDIITAYTAADVALAADITTLETSVGSFTAGGHVSFIATATPTGADSAYEIQVTASDGVTTVQTGLRFVAYAGGIGELQIVASKFTLVDPVFGSTDPVLTYDGALGRWTFGVPVYIGETEIGRGQSNDYKKVSYGALSLGYGQSAALPSSGLSITATTKTALLVSGTINFNVAGPAGATAPVVFAVFVRVNGSNEVTAYTAPTGETLNSTNQNIDKFFQGPIELAASTTPYTIDMWAQVTTAGGVSMSVSLHASKFSVFILRNVT